jgi:predicted dehydrogenase
MLAVAREATAEVVAVADAVPDVAATAASEVGARAVTPVELLEADLGLDGIVIATPNAAHADQAVHALGRGLAVFCQKPLGRNRGEAAAVVEAARRVDRLLGVDLSYRHLRTVTAMRDTIDSGALGDIYATDLVFHNAYGPDKAWFRDPDASGGGCVIDLGTHLVDLVLWMLGGPKVDGVEARLFAGGRRLDPDPHEVEDYAVARLDLVGGGPSGGGPGGGGGVVTLACSWFLHAGRDALIGATFHGSRGSVALTNVGGSFYDFRADHHRGTESIPLGLPPDDWGGRAATAWVRHLAADRSFDPAVADVVEVADVVDRIYGR